MKYLIDTHIFLWSLLEPQKLPHGAEEAIRRQENEISVSTVTFFEIALKYSLNKLELTGVTPDELPGYALQMGFETLDLNAEDAASFYHLPRISHKDPFDRLIIWQAIRGRMMLISKDTQFSAYRQFGLKLFPGY